jgi:murein L,D-transpeptidase YcbB/YkuD
MNSKNKRLLIALIVICSNWFCSNETVKEKTDFTITEETGYNNLFLDSVVIDNFLQKHSSLQQFKEQFYNFYLPRNYEYAWFDENGATEQLYNFENLLHAAVSNLQDSSIYIPELLTAIQKNNYTNLNKQQLTNLELLQTGQFFTYAQKVYKGMDVDATQLGWFIPRKKINLSQLLDSVLKGKQQSIDNYVTLNAQYKKLVEALAKYNAIKNRYRWDTLPSILSLKKGDSSTYLPQIKEQLFAFNDADSLDTSIKFNAKLVKAIIRFQKRNGLPPTGTINKKTVEQLNTPINYYIEKLLVNMERARWLPPITDSNYIFVNIPEFKLYVYDSSKLQWDMNVIVGKKATETVIFTGNLRYIVFSPYWNLPNNIVKKEVWPAYKRNVNYLAKNNMEIYGKGDSLPLIRQLPGPKNSLGLVKFLFPNNFDIYFHDTPEKNLFTANERSFSHGCIRLSNPKKLAEYLLRYDTINYKPSIIDSLMHLPKEKWVNLKKPIPVFITYFTAWVDKNGLLNFRKDIYKHDEKVANKLFSREPKDSLIVADTTKIKT